MLQTIFLAKNKILHEIFYFRSKISKFSEMTVSEEQEEEFEALQAIYPEIERYEESPEQPLLIFAIDLASETEENQLR